MTDSTIPAPDVLATERLILRRARVSDAEAIFEEYAQDPEVSRHLVWKPHRSPRDTSEFLKECEARWRAGEELSWVIVARGGERPFGMIACRLLGRAAEIGYVIGRRAWGRGYATEAARAVVDWVSGQAGIFRVGAFCDTGNPASARVLEKIGMIREGTLRRWVVHPNLSPEPRDCFVYSRVRGD